MRVLQERVVDVVGANSPVAVDLRVISATNRDLRKAVDTRAFREDLYFRLAVLPIEVPPLRDRRSDIGPLVRHFLSRYEGDRVLVPTPELSHELEIRDWRGNVRELENVCHRMALMAEDETLTPEMLPERLDPVAPAVRTGIQLPPEGISLIDLERNVIVRALELNRYNQTRAAKFLRIPRHVLLYRAEKFRIPLKP